MAADENALGELHNMVARSLTEQLKGQPIPGYEDEDGNMVEGSVIPPSAAVLAVAAKFLKDNNITCAPSKDNQMGELQRQMEERRRQRRAPTATDLSDATRAVQDRTNFMSGLPN